MILTRRTAAVVLSAVVATTVGTLQSPASASGPSVASLQVSPSSVDTTTGAQTVSVFVGIAEGTGPVASVAVDLTDAGAAHHLSGSSNLSPDAYSHSSTGAVDYFAIDVPVAAGFPAGVTSDAFNVHSVTVTPSSGGDVTLIGAALPTSAAVLVTHATDTTAPTLAGGSVDPSTLPADASDSARTVAVTLHVTDDVSGFDHGRFDLVSTSGPSWTAGSGLLRPATPRAGSAQDGFVTAAVEIDGLAPGGAYRLANLVLVDVYGNQRTIATPSPPVTFTIASHPSPAAPSASAVSVGVTSVDSTAGPATVPVTFTATSPVGSIVGASVSLSGPSGEVTDRGYVHLADKSSGDAHSATFTVGVPLPHYAAAGTWHVGTISITANDAATSNDSFAAQSPTFTVTRTTDAAAPVVAGVTRSPATLVAVGTNLASAFVSAHITDAGSGVDGVAQLDLFDGTIHRLAALAPATGSPSDGTWSGFVPLPVGTWSVSALTVTDAAGNTGAAPSGVRSAAGSITVVQGTDASAPTLTSLDLLTSTVAVPASGTAPVHLRIGYSDAGGSGFAGAQATFIPTGGAVPAGELRGYVQHVISGDSSSGVLDVTVDVPAGYATGTYRLVEVDLGDGAATMTTVGTTGIDALDPTTTLTVTNKRDAVRPTIDTLALTTPTVTSSADPATVGIRISASDDVSVDDIFVGVTSPSGQYLAEDLPVGFGNAHQSTRYDVPLPSYAEPGRWTIQDIVIYDEVGPRHYGPSDLDAMGLPYGFDVTGPVDSTGPHLAAGPGAVQVLQAPASALGGADSAAVIVLAHVVSEGAPITYAGVTVQSPSPAPPPNAAGEQGGHDVWARVIQTVRANSPAGDWTFEVDAVDAAGNRLRVSAEDLAAAGLPSRFTLQSSDDGTLGTVSGVSRTDGSGPLDTTGGQKSLGFDVAVSTYAGGLFGLRAQVLLTGPTGLVLSGEGNLFEPTASASGVIHVDVPVGPYLSSGTYALSVLLEDDWTSRTVPTTALPPGAVTSVVITGRPDTTAPSVSQVLTPTDPVDVTRGPTPVALEVRAVDDESGVDITGSVTFSAPGSPRQSITLPVNPYSYGPPRSFNLQQKEISGLQVLSVDGQVPQGARPGTWTLTGAHLVDGAGNVARLSAAGGLPAASFTVVDRHAGVTPPTLTAGPSLAPAAVDVTSTARVVRVDVVAPGAVGDIHQDDTPQSTFVVHRPGEPDETVRLSDDAVPGGLLTASLLVPRSTTPATWTIDSLTLSDAFGDQVRPAASAVLRINGGDVPPVSAPVIVVTPPGVVTTPPTSPVAQSPVLVPWTGLSLSLPKKIHSGKKFSASALVRGLGHSQAIVLQARNGKRWVTIGMLRWSGKVHHWTGSARVKGKGSVRLLVAADATHLSTTGRSVSYRTVR